MGIRAIWYLYVMGVEERSSDAAVTHLRSMRFAGILKDFGRASYEAQEIRAIGSK